MPVFSIKPEEEKTKAVSIAEKLLAGIASGVISGLIVGVILKKVD